MRREDRRPIVEIMQPDARDPADLPVGLFLRNHDELTLEMVTDEERDYMYYEYAATRGCGSTSGIRRRLAPLLDNGRRQIELLNSLLLHAARQPGPLLRRRDRHGRQHLPGRPQRRAHPDAVDRRPQRRLLRAPTPPRLYQPVIIDPVYGYQAVNVEAQLPHADLAAQLDAAADRARASRRASSAAARSSSSARANQRVLAYLREHEGETVLVVAQPLRFAPSRSSWTCARWRGTSRSRCSATRAFPPIGEQPYFLTLGPHGFYWFRLQAASADQPRYGIEATAL